MKDKNIRTIGMILLALVLVICAFGGGFASGRFLPLWEEVSSFPISAGTPSSTSEDVQTLFTPFWEAWDVIHQYYVDQPVDDTQLMEGAIRGMVEALGDPHTGYWDAQETTDAMQAMAGEYDGIGAWVDTRGEFLTITSPMEGYPAEAAGLKAGDQIIAVDGEDISEMDPEMVRLTKVLGPAGSEVVLTIRREGVAETFDVTVTRAHILVPSVTSEIRSDGIGVLQLSQFGEKTAGEVHEVLADFASHQVRGIILDLRDNGGGLTEAATSIASEFIEEGVVWYEKYGDGTSISHEAVPGGLALEIPLVVLVNENSASASELVAGAIQDYHRGTLVGVTTYGKGSVQTWQPISDGGTVRVTIALWLTPDGRTINGIGLTPDVIVKRSADDISAGLDPQMDAAVQLLLIP